MSEDARFKRSMSLDPGALAQKPGPVDPKKPTLQKSVSFEEPCKSKKVRKEA
jgi:hypothetical protein